MSSESRPITFPGIRPADILLPGSACDPAKWAVIACDQYTSEPAYWEETERIVGSAPSALKMIFPEVWLGSDDQARIASINTRMHDALRENLFSVYPDSFILVHRTTDLHPQGRWGLVAALDLEEYDYAKDAKSLIRATEGTIMERIPPRMKIRENAPIELPHIIVLIDDEQRSVIEPLTRKLDALTQLYSFELMQGGGRAAGYRIHLEEDLLQIAQALNALADRKRFRQRYDSEDLMLYAMGDGNHSLATAKACWEAVKQKHRDNPELLDLSSHPARFALVEIENIYDEGIDFEPIHRVLFNCDLDAFLAELRRWCSRVELSPAESLSQIETELLNTGEKDGENHQVIGLATSHGLSLVSMIGPSAEIAAGTLQTALDAYLSSAGPQTKIDYTHGLASTYAIGIKPGNCALLLPPISKESFFAAVIHDGALPRKTFSMGEAHEKRYYIEARKIVP